MYTRVVHMHCMCAHCTACYRKLMIKRLRKHSLHAIATPMHASLSLQLNSHEKCCRYT